MPCVFPPLSPLQVGYQEMLLSVQAAYASEGGLERERDPWGEVAKNWRVPGFRGTVSFITSMTQHFCGDCNRLGRGDLDDAANARQSQESPPVAESSCC